MASGDELGAALKKAGAGPTKINRAGRQISKAGWGLSDVLHPGKLSSAQLAQGPPGIGEQVQDIVKAAPAGVVQFAKGVASDPLAAAATGALIGGAAATATGPGALIGAGVGAGVGFAGYGLRSLLDDEPVDMLETSKQMADSFTRTAGRLRHPTRYGKESDRGSIVGAILEDVANLSMVASAGAKGLNAATGGAAREAATAGASAKSFTAAAKAEAEQVAKLTSEATVPGISPALRASKMKLAEHLAGSVDAWTAQAADATARATAAEGRAGMLLKPYKVAEKASNLGAKGANLPAGVYTGTARGVGRALEKIGAKASPYVENALASSEIGTQIVDSLTKMRSHVESFKERHLLRSQAADEIHAGAMRAVQESEQYRRLRDAWMKDVPDEIEQQAGMIAATGIPEQLAQLHADAGPDVVAHIIGYVTQKDGEFFGARPEAMKLAMEYARGLITDEETAQRLVASEQYAREVSSRMEQGYLDLRGMAPEQQTGAAGEANRANREWQVYGEDANPVAVARAEAERKATMDAAGKDLGESRSKLERATGRMTFTPEQLKAPVKATRQDVTAAMRLGGQFAQEHPEIAAQLFPDAAGPLEMQRLLADAVLQARNADIVEHLPQPLIDAIGAQEWSGDKSIIGRLAPAEKLIRQGKREGVAEVGQQIADRLTKLAEEAKARGDKSGAALADARAKLPKTNTERIVRAAAKVQRAVDRVQRTKARAERLAEPERLKVVAKAERALTKEVHAQRSTIRKALYEQSNDELAALAQDMGGWFPGSHPKWLQRVARGDQANVRHPSIDHWNRLMDESEMPSLVTRPPGVIPSGHRGESIDILIDNYRRAVPEFAEAAADDVLDAILSRLNGAAQNRLMANGIVGRGAANLRWAETALAMQGFGEADMAGLLPMLAEGTPKDVARSMMDASAVSPVTEASAARVLDAVEARFRAEQEGVRGEIPNRELADYAEGTPRAQPVSSPIPKGTLTPFEQSLADRVFAQAKLVAAERNEPRVSRQILSRIVDEAATKGFRAGRDVGTQAGLERGAAMAGATAERAGVAAAEGATEAMGGAATLAGRGFGVGVTAGRQARDVAIALREVGVKERAYERLDARTQEQVLAAHDSVQNAPSRYRPLLRFNEVAQQGIEDYIAEFLKAEDGHDPLVAEQLRAFAADIPVTLAAAVDAGFNPRYSIGGKIGEVVAAEERRSTAGTLPRVSKLAETRERIANAGPSSAEETAQLAVQRTTAWVRNETAYRLQARFGTAPSSVIGIRPEDAGLDTTDVRTAEGAEALKEAMTALREQAREKGLAIVGDGGNVIAIPAELINGRALAAEMKKRGYVAWNPASLFDTVPADQVKLSTTFVPEPLLTRFKNQIGPASEIEKAFRKFYDKPMRVWKDQVLALSPRWHVNNIIGGMVTATAGGGINPLTYGRNFAKATKILRAMHDDGRLAALEKSDPEGAQLALHMDPRIHQGSEAAALGAGTDLNIENKPKLPSRAKSKLVRGYKAATGKSYEFNGFVDDANRLAVFLTERDRMTNAQLAEWVRRNPDLGYSFGKGQHGLEGIRDELAVRQSLKVVGDFTRLSKLERTVIRRVLPFYPWMRHITKLALRMPAVAPVRVAWMMHLAEVFGEAPAFPFLTGYLPMGAEAADQSREYLHIGNVNPFQDIGYGSQGSSDWSITDIPGGVASNASPAITAGAALGLGIDLRTGSQLTRPAGSYKLDLHGRDSSTPLAREPGLAAGYLARLLPAYNVGRAVVDGLEYGGKVPLRYPTGQVMKSQGQIIFSDRPSYGPATDLLGIPLGGTEKVSLAELRGRRDERIRRAAASRRRYAGATSSPAGGGRLPSWGS